MSLLFFLIGINTKKLIAWSYNEGQGDYIKSLNTFSQELSSTALDDTRICFCMVSRLECWHFKGLVGEHFLRLGANENYSIHVSFQKFWPAVYWQRRKTHSCFQHFSGACRTIWTMMVFLKIKPLDYYDSISSELGLLSSTHNEWNTNLKQMPMWPYTISIQQLPNWRGVSYLYLGSRRSL